MVHGCPAIIIPRPLLPVATHIFLISSFPLPLRALRDVSPSPCTPSAGGSWRPCATKWATFSDYTFSSLNPGRLFAPSQNGSHVHSWVLWEQSAKLFSNFRFDLLSISSNLDRRSNLKLLKSFSNFRFDLLSISSNL